MFDFLVIGHTVHVTDTSAPFNRIIGNAIRAVSMAEQLARKGYSVALVVDFKNRDNALVIYRGMSLVCRKSLEHYIRKSSALIFCTTKPEVLINEHGVNIDCIEHKNKILLSCFVSSLSKARKKSLYDQFQLISVNNSEQVKLTINSGTKTPVFQLDFGAPEVNESLTPFSQRKGLWVGSIRSKEVLIKIIKTARAFPEISFDIVSRLIFRAEDITALPGNKIQGAVVNLLDDTPPPANVENLLSSWASEQWPSNLHFLGAAEDDYHQVLASHTIGLDFCQSKAQSHDNTKIIDYLSSGMFVLTEKFAPSYRYAEEVQNGYIVSNFDTLASDLNFKAVLDEADRSAKKEVFMQQYSWQSITERFLSEYRRVKVKPTK